MRKHGAENSNLDFCRYFSLEMGKSKLEYKAFYANILSSKLL